MFVQSRQFARLRNEIGKINITKSSNLSINQQLYAFYHQNYGYISVDNHFKDSDVASTRSKKGKNPIIYYPIWKNGNTYIRYLLYHFAATFNPKEDINPHCTDCHISNLISIPSEALASHHHRHDQTSSKKSGDRFIFTFIRHPLTRFIAGYAEIIYRMKIDVNESTNASIDNIHDFLMSYLVPGIVDYLPHNQNGYFDHLIPQLGTHLITLRKEHRSLRKYRLEAFDEEWKRLSKDLDAPVIYDIYRKYNNHSLHHSSLDVDQVAFNALTFLSYAHEDYHRILVHSSASSGACQDAVFCDHNRRRLDVNSHESVDMQPKALRTLRAHCRIYFTDYLCLNYSLPSVCSDLFDEEFPRDVDEFHVHNSFHQQVHRRGLMVYLIRYYFPSWLGRSLAEVLCWGEREVSPPECIIDVMEDLRMNDFETNNESLLEDEDEVDEYDFLSASDEL